MSSGQNYAPTPGTALPISQAVTTAAETLLLANSVAVASSPASLQPATGATPLQVAIPANSILVDKRFKVLLSGEIQCEGAENLTVKLYGIAGAQISPTIGNNTLLASSGAQAVAAAGTLPFLVEAELVYGQNSGKLVGTSDYAGSVCGAGACLSARKGQQSI